MTNPNEQRVHAFAEQLRTELPAAQRLEIEVRVKSVTPKPDGVEVVGLICCVGVEDLEGQPTMECGLIAPPEWSSKDVAQALVECATRDVIGIATEALEAERSDAA